MTSSNCCFLTCIQISREAGQLVWYSHLFQNFPQFIVTHTVKGFGIVNKAEIDVCWHIECSTFTASSFRIWNRSIGIPSPPLTLFVEMLSKTHLTSHASGGGRIPVEPFQILKVILWKCCTQYVSKFGKLSSGHRTGKGQFSFQFQRKAMPKNAQTTTQL